MLVIFGVKLKFLNCAGFEGITMVDLSSTVLLFIETTLITQNPITPLCDPI